MSPLKKLAGVKANQNMHNNEDARVKVPDAPQQKDNKEGVSWKAKIANAAKVVKRIPYYVWLWEKVIEAWDWFYENAESIFEVIS